MNIIVKEGVNILKDSSMVFWHVYFHDNQHLSFSLPRSLEGMSGILLKVERIGSLVVYYYRHSFPDKLQNCCIVTVKTLMAIIVAF